MTEKEKKERKPIRLLMPRDFRLVESKHELPHFQD
jgi:hypothetical protein